MTSRYDRLKPVFHIQDFRALWLAVICSQLGFGMLQVLLGWLVLAMTDSDAMVGMAFAVRSAPNLLVGFVVGALTDRWDRRTLMRLAAGGLTLTALLLAFLLFTDRLAVWHLLLCTGILGMWQALDLTARQVYVYDLLGSSSAVQGIALISLAQRLGGAFGALLAGITLQWWGASTSFMIMACGYAMGLCLLVLLRHHGVAAPVARESMRTNLQAYWQALRTNQGLRSLILSTALAEALGFSHQVMLPILVKDVLRTGAASLGLLTAFRFLGGLIGVGLLTMGQAMSRQGRLLMLVLIAFGGGVIGLSQVTHFWVAALWVAFINIMATATDILHHTLLQFSVANEQRGRAMGSWIVGTGTAPIGQLEIGYLASLSSARMALLINGVGLITVALGLIVCVPRLWRL